MTTEADVRPLQLPNPVSNIVPVRGTFLHDVAIDFLVSPPLCWAFRCN